MTLLPHQPAHLYISISATITNWQQNKQTKKTCHGQQMNQEENLAAPNHGDPKEPLRKKALEIGLFITIHC